jgi:hypothetical protein
MSLKTKLKDGRVQLVPQSNESESSNNFKKERKSESIGYDIVLITSKLHCFVEMNSLLRLVRITKTPNHGIPKKRIRFMNSVEYGKCVIHHGLIIGNSTKHNELSSENKIVMKTS